MKILLGVGFAFRIALLCLFAGFALGLYVGIRATGGEAAPAAGAAAPRHVAVGAALVPGLGREVSPWKRIPTRSFCS
jgi:hypothetical protein